MKRRLLLILTTAGSLLAAFYVYRLVGQPPVAGPGPVSLPAPPPRGGLRGPRRAGTFDNVDELCIIARDAA